MAEFRDTRHPMERVADERYAAARVGRAVDIAQAVTSTAAIGDAADKIVAARVLGTIARNRKMSLLGKMQHLTEAAQDFHKSTEAVLDGISEKIVTATTKRDEAAQKHHVYYDAIIAGVDDSVAVIDRLSNVPLGDGGEG